MATRHWTHRRTVIVAAVAGVVVAGAVVATVVLTSGGGSGHTASPGHGSYTASAPWRIRIDGTAYGDGCSLTLTDTTTGTPFDLPGKLYSIARYQIPQAGAFTWTTTDRHCLVTALPGQGHATLPFLQDIYGDTDVFAAPSSAGVDVTVVNNYGGYCTLRLYTAAGQELDTADWKPGDGSKSLDTTSATSVYVSDDNCAIRVSAKP